MLTIARSEPLEDGGVFALIGPTGAGKTTTLAKLAARFAQRHRARDVALVNHRHRAPRRARAAARARPQARRHVCEADGPKA